MLTSTETIDYTIVKRQPTRVGVINMDIKRITYASGNTAFLQLSLPSIDSS